MPSIPPDPVIARRVEIGDQLRLARFSAGLTQEQLALRCGLDRPSVVRIEKGQQDPHLSTLIRIEGVIGARLTLSVDGDSEVNGRQ
ncbi:helix-turn-helix transcriptional regulator [Actinacidiphila sp. ITFR-21]|uniref:helix-turn-helix transcriptional regulator n=1 Tax=Actinacidiphila sp. ITFR-21 TaxID=3075199 RepID=UPI00288AD750|nr:helix-turn-helix transcriptional regulator [Streptomyces sp. ITFR-21]WNI16598.1 helix-turn-helix transcriptional regulator [Streptomyces sp. ITFR-21]